MRTIICSALGVVFAFSLATARVSELGAQGPSAAAAGAAPPDFSGVYYPVQAGRGGAGRGQAAGAPAGRGQAPGAPAGAPRGGPPPRPTTSAPLSDGSQGRSPDAPSLTPEYLA